MIVQINYRHPDMLDTNVCVIVDGICNHASTHEEKEFYDHYLPSGNTFTEETRLEVCDKCSAWRDALDEYDHWHGIEIMPTPWEGL